MNLKNISIQCSTLMLARFPGASEIPVHLWANKTTETSYTCLIGQSEFLFD